MRKIIAKHKKHWSNKRIAVSSFFGFIVFLISLCMNYFASVYATEMASNSVQDIIISNVRVFNVDFIVNDMAFAFFLFILTFVLINPKKIPFAFKSAALLIAIRSIFITLTHLGPFAQRT